MGVRRAWRLLGSVGASGTEGSLWALYLAREAFPDAVLIHSSEAHYSVPKAARILRMETVSIGCTSDGAIDLEALAEAVALLDRPVIVALTCGTTVKGAHDDIGGVLACLDAAGIGPHRRFVLVDGALNALVLPFLDDVPFGIRPSFRHAIDSIHLRPQDDRNADALRRPRGAAATRRAYRLRHRLPAVERHHTNGVAQRPRRSLDLVAPHRPRRRRLSVGRPRLPQRAARLTTELRAAGVPTLHNPHALTVVFPEPSEAIVRITARLRSWQSPCDRHAQRDGEFARKVPRRVPRVVARPSGAGRRRARSTRNRSVWRSAAV